MGLKQFHVEENNDVSVFKRGNWWWYELMYKGVRIGASSKSTDRTVAERAEVKKRWELDHPDEACFVCANCGTIQRTAPLSINLSYRRSGQSLPGKALRYSGTVGARLRADHDSVEPGR
jgi:hypothetical protein